MDNKILKNKKHRSKNKKSWYSYRRWYLKSFIAYEIWIETDYSMPFLIDDKIQYKGILVDDNVVTARI